MNDQDIYTKFFELAEIQLALFPGNLCEKMTAWYMSILSASHRFCKKRANMLFFHIIQYLNENERTLLPNYLEVYLRDNCILVGDKQLGFLCANAMTGEIKIDTRWKYIPVLPTYISLYKYVSWEVLKLILGNGKLAVSIPCKCNDIYEFMPAWESEDEKQYIMQTMAEMEIVMLCLTRTPNSSVMWGHYANNGSGALLEFRVPVYRLIAGRNEQESMLIVAKNEHELSKIDSNLPILISQVSYAEYRPKLGKVASFYEYDVLYSRKGKDWAYEQEMRILFNYDDYDVTQENGRYLTSILTPYLSSIVLGPRNEKSEKDVREEFGEALKDLKGISIMKTKPSPQSYKLDISLTETPKIEEMPMYRRKLFGIPYSKLKPSVK